MRDYLAALVESVGTRDACTALGLGSNSYSSLKRLCDLYGVSIPKRSNQHAPVVEPVKIPPRPQRISHPATRRKVGVERCIVVGDIHVPCQDDDAVELALAIVADLAPEVLVINGDLIDLPQVSKYSVTPERIPQLQADLDEARAVLSRFRAAAPRSDMRLVRGNHEIRVERWLADRAPALYGLRALSLPDLLGLDELGISYVTGPGKGAFTRYGDILIGHFDKVAQQAGYTATRLLQHYSQSLVQGHTHRGALVYHRYPDGREVMAAESFCLCSTEPTYCDSPDWMNGLIVINKRTDTGRYHIVPVPFVDGEALVDGTLYST